MRRDVLTTSRRVASRNVSENKRFNNTVPWRTFLCRSLKNGTACYNFSLLNAIYVVERYCEKSQHGKGNSFTHTMVRSQTNTTVKYQDHTQTHTHFPFPFHYQFSFLVFNFHFPRLSYYFRGVKFLFFTILRGGFISWRNGVIDLIFWRKSVMRKN